MKRRFTLICFIVSLAMLLTLMSGCSSKTEDGTGGDSAASSVGTDTQSSGTDTPPTGSEPSANGSAGDSAAPGDTSGGSEFLFSDNIDANGFWIGIRALDYVELFDYNALLIPFEVHYISDETIQAELEYILAEFPSVNQITDRAIVDGDTVNIDFVGSIDGVEFENGSTDGYGTEVIIGETQYIDDFLEQLIGHLPGETVNVEVTFPDDYYEESLRGKDALFVTDINFIVESAESVMSDDFVLENLAMNYGWTTVEELEEGLRSYFQSTAIQGYIQDYITTEVTVHSVPQHLIDFQENAMLQYYRGYAEMYEMDLEDFIGMYEGYYSVDEFVEAYHEENVVNATFYLVLQAVAEDSGMRVDDADMASYFADQFGTPDYSSFEEHYGLPYLKQIVLCQKVLDYIEENAVLG